MTERFRSEDCGLEFDEGEFSREDPPMACPYSEGLDAQVVGEVSDETTQPTIAESRKTA